jgi:hypothetical protein
MTHRLVDISLQERKRVAGLARSPKCRISASSAQRPCRWDPAATLSEGGFSHTHPGAWARIAEHLESGGQVYATELDRPPGLTAYVIFLEPTQRWRGIYIKFELTHPGIYGRSFHHPDHPVLEIITENT